MAKKKATPTSGGKTSKAAGKPDAHGEVTVVTRNRKAKHDYELIDKLECGMQLMGSEVKSIRNGKIVIDDGFARVQRGELWLINVDIAEYPQANFMNHARQRERKLLVRKAQLRKLIDATHDRGVTLVPLQVHFRRGVAKIQIATAKGRKSHDKRQRLKQKAADREIREKWRR